MSSMIEQFDSMVSARGLVPWHRRGNVTNEVLTADTALDKSGLGWQVKKRKLRVVPEDGDAFDGQEPIKGHVVLMRDDIWMPLGVVTDQFIPVQNHEMFAVLEPFVRDGTLSYETAGSLRNGRTVWVQCRFPQLDTDMGDGEKVEAYLALLNGHDGSRSLTALPTMTRIVCNNTMQRAENSATLSLSTAHIGNVQARMEDMVRVLAGVSGSMHEMVRVFERMRETELSPEGVISYFERVFPVPSGATRRIAEAIQAKRDTCNAWRAAPENQRVSNYNPMTLWAAYGGVTRFASHVVGHRVKDENAYQLTGDGAQLRRAAYATAEEVLQGV